MDVVNKLLSFIPDDKLEAFSFATKVDKYTKKLTGKLFFKLLLYCCLTEKDTSLRGAKSSLESAIFRTLAGITGEISVSHSSISERLNVIEVDYFERIFDYCYSFFKGSPTRANGNIVHFDSTIVSLSTKLLGIGYNLKGGDAANYRLLKFTVGYSDMPDCICFYTGQRHNSENTALSETILKNQKAPDQINVFDRGITSRRHYDTFTVQGISFISRTAPTAYKKTDLPNTLKKPVKTKTLRITSDSWVYLFSEGKVKSKYPVRLIEAERLDSKEKICFVTNKPDLGNIEITEIYRKRWDIEVFFKFLKQHLNFGHLLNRSENGVKVIMYVTMIAAILLQEYKKLKKMDGFKIPKKKFAIELENNILFEFVLLCKGDPTLAKRLIYPNST
jgi:Transposase DDE domain